MGQAGCHSSIRGSVDAALGLIISWHHEGGSTGNCGDLDIYVTGEVDATACEGATPLEFGQAFLFSDQLEQLYSSQIYGQISPKAWLSLFEFSEGTLTRKG